MKRLLTLLIFSFITLATFAQGALNGKVTDSKNAPLVGAVVYIPDLKIGAATKADGTYQLKNLPKGSYLVEIRLLGYGVQTKTVKLQDTLALDVVLTESEIETQEVVITGTSAAASLSQTPLALTEVTHEYLQQNTSTNIIDALSKVPGVSGITDGQSIAKPVIRGLGYNRVVTVNDGVRQEGQQWGDEFGIEVDPNSVDRVEILKGPGSLVYGSDAISGVINLIPENTLPEGQVKGDINYGYQSNNGLHNIMAHLAGNINGFTFSGRVTNIMAHAYQNANDGYVYNSQFSNLGYDATLGYHKKLGYTQVHFSYFDLRTGIVEGGRDSVTGAFTKHNQIAQTGADSATVATYQDLTSYTPALINQVVQHYKVVWDNSLAVGQGRIIGRFAWQQNRRQEHNDPTIPDIANIYYFLNTFNYDLRYVSQDWKGFNFSAGANGMYQKSTNRGTLLLIPEYNLFDVGAFAIANYKYKILTLSGGIRYDVRRFQANDDYVDSSGNQLSSSDPSAIHRFTAYSSNFNGLSASLGATVQLPKDFYLKANVGRGFRAPNVAESGSNGIHDGTVVYEIGNPNLKPENSLQFDLEAGLNNKNLSIALNGFVNMIDNYIYPKQLKNSQGQDSVRNDVVGFPDAPVFDYTQGKAILYGGEAVLDIHPEAIPWFDLYAGYSIVHAQLTDQPDSTKYLPFTPPAKLKVELTLKAKHFGKVISNPYFRFGVNYTFKQTDVYQQTSVYYALPALESTASASPSDPYALLNASIGTDIKAGGRKVCTLIFSVDNLADVAYKDYMSRFKYYPVNYATNPARVGVYNMGRNFSVKLLIPLDFKKG